MHVTIWKYESKNFFYRYMVWNWAINHPSLKGPFYPTELKTLNVSILPDSLDIRWLFKIKDKWMAQARTVNQNGCILLPGTKVKAISISLHHLWNNSTIWIINPLHHSNASAIFDSHCFQDSSLCSSVSCAGHRKNMNSCLGRWRLRTLQCDVRYHNSVKKSVHLGFYLHIRNNLKRLGELQSQFLYNHWKRLLIFVFSCTHINRLFLKFRNKIRPPGLISTH